MYAAHEGATGASEARDHIQLVHLTSTGVPELRRPIPANLIILRNPCWIARCVRGAKAVRQMAKKKAILKFCTMPEFENAGSVSLDKSLLC
jgi:hypothetical protein